jgi:5-formaminoimidazole-4-carboxamide-1-(beta)-D-ribofuranosyl 5'-monophosphate synthetase
MIPSQLPRIATLGSHSALEMCAGARAQGFSTLVVAQKGREKTYSHYFKNDGQTGCVDEVLLLERFDELLDKKIQRQLTSKDALFIPNRSFEVYLHNDYTKIEQDFAVPMFSNKYLLRMEERTGELTQYAVLQAAQIRTPQEFTNPADIDRLCIVKAQQKEKSFERAFFFASTPQEYESQFQERVESGLIDPRLPLRIEEYIVGVQVNLNFFYSPLNNQLELVGTDTRRQTNISGFVTLPAAHQQAIGESLQLSFDEAGHMAVTILESMLEPAFELGERFVAAAKTFHPKGIIGPFSLQCSVVTGKKGKEFVVFDVSPRLPGSPGITATPYSGYRYGRRVSMGERVAMEIKQAMEQDALKEITT